MAQPIRPQTDFLTTLRAVVGADHGAALLDALGSEMARRRGMESQAPEAWSLETALEALEANPHRASLFGAIRLLQGAQPGKVPLGYSRRPEDEAVRLDQTLLLGFAASEVDAVSADP